MAIKSSHLTQKVKFPPLSDTLYSELIIVWGFFMSVSEKLKSDFKLDSKEAAFCIKHVFDEEIPTRAYYQIYNCKYPSARALASKKLSKDNIKKAIDFLLDMKLDLLSTSFEELASEMKAIALAQPHEFYDEQGNVLPLHKMSERAQKAVSQLDEIEMGEQGIKRTFKRESKTAAIKDLDRMLEKIHKKKARTAPDTYEDKRHNQIIKAIASYTAYTDTLLILGLEEYEFQKLLVDDFREDVKDKLAAMLFEVNSSIPDVSTENPKSDIIRGWLKAINDGVEYSTVTRMYINILNGADDFTFAEDFWGSPEGVKVASSLRDYFRETKDFVTFLSLAHRRVLKKELIRMPYVEKLAEFYCHIIESGRKRFAIVMPPRHGKSTFLTLLIDWIFMLYPDAQMILFAYGDAVLQHRRNVTNMGLNGDPFYRNLVDVHPINNNRFGADHIDNTAGGKLFLTTIFGSPTGQGGSALAPEQKGFVLADDPNAPKWVGTQHQKNANDAFFNVFISRAPHLPIGFVQQCVGEDGLFHEVLKKSNETDPLKEYRWLICYIAFDKNETTDAHYLDMKKRYPNVDWWGYEDMDSGVINPTMAHYANKETCPEAWHIFMTQYQGIPTSPDSAMFNGDMLIRASKNEIVTDSRTGVLYYAKDGDLSQSIELRILFHIDTSSLDERTEGSDFTAFSVFGVGCANGIEVGILFEQYQKQDIGLPEFLLDYERIAEKWMGAFNRNAFLLAVEQKMTGAVVRTECESINAELAKKYDVNQGRSLELKRPAGESKVLRGGAASQSLQANSWFRWYPYDLGFAINSKFAHQGEDLSLSDKHWYYEFRYQVQNFTGHESSRKDDCVEGIDGRSQQNDYRLRRVVWLCLH